MMVHRILTAVGTLVILSSPLFAKTITVSQDGSADYSSIQAAVNAAGPGDEVIINDTSIYQEQVTIDSTKDGLTLRSENPLAAAKPTILFRDTVNIGPKSCAEAKDTTKITYWYNGALRFIHATNVRVEGMVIDGGAAFPFGYEGIWREGLTDCRWPNQYGNAAICIHTSGEAIIRDCSIRNAYYGLYIIDINEGGVFAHSNPGVPYPPGIEPLSGFACTGNHLIEYNRIHDNSFGLFFESSWDMGSTVRYNLIYENHHTSAIASKVKALTPDGANQPGGAFMFKDQLISPLAIYNNTFWHNMFIFVGGWNCAGVHLVFNNIFGEPYIYWNNESTFGDQYWQELSSVFTNRMHSCVFAAHQQKPDPSYISIMNNMGQPRQEGDTIPRTFSAGANVRWLESHFLSTDTSSDLFLMPDWNNQLVQQYIIDQGWSLSGVNDPNGTPADLGAIPKEGGRPLDVVTIRPTIPLTIVGNTIDCGFTITPRIGIMIEPKIVFLRLVKNLDTVSAFGNDCPVVKANDIVDIQFPVSGIRIGVNQFSIPLPESISVGTYAFFELFMGGTGTGGRQFTTAAGFVPYRKLPSYRFVVEIINREKSEKMVEVRAGEPVVLRVKAMADDTTSFADTIKFTSIRLQSRLGLQTPDKRAIDSIPGGITGSVDLEVVFAAAPIGCTEFVTVTGRCDNGGTMRAFLGSSEAITVLPDPTNVRPVVNAAVRSGSILCELIDLRGRVVQRFAAVSSLQAGRTAGYTTALTRTTGSGLYLIRMTDVTTGRVTMQRRMVLGR